MQTCLAVGAGGALGAICRYLYSLIPFPGPFPVATLLINLFGAVVIGFVTGLAEHQPNIPFGLILFLKTGVCGGFTTFSTFSLETVTLFEQKRPALGILYACISVLLCVLGVLIGKLLAQRIA